MTSTIQLRAQNGVRNDVSPERFDRDVQGRRTGFTDLSAATNLDLDETGKLARRIGTTNLATGTMHSLFADGDEAYVVKDSMLSKLNADMSVAPVAPVSDRVAMVRIVNSCFWSDGHTAGIVSKGVNIPWGIAVPPICRTVETSGDLQAGIYLYALTYVRMTGEESGAQGYGSITVPANSGISFPMLPFSTDPFVVEKRLYVSACNGELGYLVATIPNGQVSAVLTSLGNPSTPLRTQFMGPPPAGQAVGYFAGRSLIASDNYLWYSNPHEYGLFDLRSGFVGLKSPVHTIAPVTDGVFIGTDTETFWLAGTDPAAWTLVSKATYGTVRGTEIKLLNHLVGFDGASGTVIGWMSKRGFCHGYDGGEMKNVTGDRYIPPVAQEGASLLKIRGGTPQVVTTLFS